MGDIKGFTKYTRSVPNTEGPEQRTKHFDEFYLGTADHHKSQQAARCMDCGVPFCHNGCPLGNLIPDFNDAVYRNEWKEAFEILQSTNNFPEFTGRICPAPCEASCVLSINNDPVAIEYIEKSIIEKAFENGWVKPLKPKARTSSHAAVVGSGPSGLACAEQLNLAGHRVTVFEKADRIGGLLRYGIPDFKLSKDIVDRRIALMESAGIRFVINTNVGVDITADELLAKYDAVVLCGGSTVARELDIPGRGFKGIHLAMDYLSQNNKKVAGDAVDNHSQIKVNDQNVLVIGGGDTGSDCIGTSIRLGAESVLQIELLGQPPMTRKPDNPWPVWPMVLRTSSSQEEGCDREWGILTKRFVSENGVDVSGVELVDIRWEKGNDGRNTFVEIEGTTRILPCDKVFLAIGFLHPQKEGLLNVLGVKYDRSGNVMTDKYQTSVEKVFSAGDMRRGQSLVVWAISEGREAAGAVDQYLARAQSVLLSKEKSLLAV